MPAVKDSKAIRGKGVVGKVDGKSVGLFSPKAATETAHVLSEVQDRITLLNDQGKMVSVLVVDNEAIGLIATRDEPREDTKSGVDALQALGIKTLMLTGDNDRTGKAIAEALGMDARTELLPEDKQRIVKELLDKCEVVAKIGDGINDAPALTAADIGIAMAVATMSPWRQRRLPSCMAVCSISPR
ncbi:HAD-IC family P-type ATPase [Asticcacaulis taihuensis]|uniref:HAD-IC family P-type ATPase n=1 Tax=Asticcacaulis taihuensis TaxID=260084 RepID=UPI003F7C3280